MLRAVVFGACVMSVACVVTKAHVVYMTHLDIGFTDTSRNVCDLYFEKYFPQAWATSETLRKACKDDDCPRFRWTEFPWLIQEFLDGRAGCAHRQRTPNEIKRMEAAIANDDVIWHANGLNNFNELSDSVLVEYSLDLRRRLNARFNKTHGALIGKLTDVTGMSRAMVPLLSRFGVKAFHIGYNGVGGLPLVAGQGTPYQSGQSFCGKDTGCPSEAVFRWEDIETGTEVLMFIEDNYGTQITIPVGEDEEIALVFQYFSDNGGVPSADDVVVIWKALHDKFPSAKIVASSLDDFVAEVLQRADYKAIPLVRGELGDSWLYGAGADPVKAAQFRLARRVLEAAVEAREVNTSWWQYDSYMRRLMKGPPEHNWGLSIGGACSDCRGTYDSWNTETFAAARKSDTFRMYECPPDFMPGAVRWGEHRAVCGYEAIEREWAEQREWVHPQPSWAAVFGWGRSNREQAPLSRDQERKWAAFVSKLEDQMIDIAAPEPPSTDGLQEWAFPTSMLYCGNVTVRFDYEGAITILLDSYGKLWANGTQKVLGQVRYTTYSAADFAEFAKEWNNHGDDFDKRGMQLGGDESAEWGFDFVKGYGSNDGRTCRVVVELKGRPSVYGPPQSVWVSYVLGAAASKGLVDMEVVWARKPATRLPEAMWVSFTPIASTRAQWAMSVLDSNIDPLDVVPRGTRYMHAVWDGYTLMDGAYFLKVQPLDSPLVAPGDRSHLLRYAASDEQPDAMGGGMHANIYNNVWGTAFPQWYEDDGIARFVLSSHRMCD